MLCSNPIIIASDPKNYLSFPDVTNTPDGGYLCVYREANKHHATESNIVLSYSENGTNWKTVTTLKASVTDHGFIFNCPRVGQIDERLYLLCDIKTCPMERYAEWGIYFWPISNDLQVLDPINLNISGMVPDHIIEYDNMWLLAYHVIEGDSLVQMAAHSHDIIHWRDRTTIGADDKLHLCEGSIVNHNDALTCYMRNNIDPEAAARLSSSDNPKNWTPSQPIPIAAHRIVAGVKEYPPYEDCVIGTYRDTINRSVSLFIIDGEQWQNHTIAVEKKKHLYDFGYTGWAENEDGSLLVVYYMCGEDPKPKICSMRVDL